MVDIDKFLKLHGKVQYALGAEVLPRSLLLGCVTESEN